MDILLESLQNYYTDENHMGQLLSILCGKQKISLRIIDWFVTNYSKKYNIYYLLYKDKQQNIIRFSGSDDEFLKQFNTYHSYKSQLKSYSKKRFDPFCRRERIEFNYGDGKTLNTTVGQLNFFKWAIDNLVVDYIKEHFKEIEEDMNKSYHLVKKQKKNSKERKQRQELSKSASRGLSAHNIKVVLDFN
tara:strand:- start:130 stop:696 length:567 start_codon:yes stop_codon:yes gene_type:complete